MSFQYVWELDLGGAGTPLPLRTKQGDITLPVPVYLFDLSPYYYIPKIDITVMSPLTGYYDRSVTGLITPYGISVYLPDITEVTWSIGVNSNIATDVVIFNEHYGNVASGHHTGSGLEFFSFGALKTTYRDVWTVTGSGLSNPNLVFRCGNKYNLNIDGKPSGQGYSFIPVEASGNNLSDVTNMVNMLPNSWDTYYPVYVESSRTPTVSGTGRFLIDLTISPHTSTVSGGEASCSGSRTVVWLWSHELPQVSGYYGLSSYSIPEAYYALQTKLIGDAIGIHPKDIRKGLLAWHTFQEDGPVYGDYSGNDLPASGVRQMARVMGKHDYALGLDDYPYGHVGVDGLGGQGEYMCSFWFKPTQLLTSGTQDYFTIFEADAFYGDDFKDSHDYNIYSIFKGWTRLNDCTTCSAGYQSDHLILKGDPNTDWFGGTWDAGTIYFDIEKEKDWDIEIKFSSTSPLSYGQTAGFIFFNKTSYFDYCSLVWQADRETQYQLIDSSIPAMTSANTPSPLVVTESSYFANNSTYKGWHVFEDPATSLGGACFYSGSGSLPEWVRLDLGAGTLKIIQGYRLRRLGQHFPRDWEFQGSNDGTNWDTLHLMVNQPDLADGQWTSWFYFNNEDVYRYYRFYITESQTGTSYVKWDGTEFYVKEKDPLPVGGNIVLRTEDLEYVINESASVDSTWLFQMQKRGDYVWFNYRDESAPAWSSPIYRMDISLWSDNMALGLQSSNASGDAPEVLFDYFKFLRGKKPDDMGDAEVGGRLLVTYNQIDVDGHVEERTDSRLWVMSDRDGFAYGTANYHWEPDRWYLIQLGFKPNAQQGDINTNFCWWVDARQTTGEVVGSGTWGSHIIPSGVTFNYYDPALYTTESGSFQLDEVSHWSRWLTNEEILKMVNKVSQIAWHRAESYIEGESYVLDIGTGVSGTVSTWLADPEIDFEYHTQYQSPQIDEQEVRFEKISYRMQHDLKLFAFLVDQAEIGILRASSGWVANNLGCYCFDPVGPEDPITLEATHAEGYSTLGPSALLDGNPDTYYSTGIGPKNADIYVMFNYLNKYTKWKGLRFRASDHYTYWDDDYPRKVNIYGSNKQNPELTDDDDWEFKFQIEMNRTARDAWGQWTEFPYPILYLNYRIKFVSNTWDTTNWIVVTGMGIDTEGVPSPHQNFDIRGDVTIFTLPFNNPEETIVLIQTYNSLLNQYEIVLLDPNLAKGGVRIPQYDRSTPEVFAVQPTKNERFVHHNLEWYDDPYINIRIQEKGDEIWKASSRVWIRRDGMGYDSGGSIDNFCTYDFNLKPTGSGYGWLLDNIENAESAHINRGYSSTACLDYGDLVASGVQGCLTTSGIEESLDFMYKGSYHYDPTCLVHGTHSLELTTRSGVWVSEERTAPYVYFNVPSGINTWTYEAEVRLYYLGDVRGHSAGLLIRNEDNLEEFFGLFRVETGVVCIDHTSPPDPTPVFVDIPASEPLWLRAVREEAEISFYWSSDYENWVRISPFARNYPLHEAMTDYDEPAPYRVYYSDDESYSGRPAWRAFDLNEETTSYWMATGQLTGGVVWLTIDFGDKVAVSDYDIRAKLFEGSFTGGGSSEAFPKRWYIQGSNDNATWINLDYQDNQMAAWYGGLVGRKNLAFIDYYRYYRFYVTQSWQWFRGLIDSYLWVNIQNLKYYGHKLQSSAISGTHWSVGLSTVNDTIHEVEDIPISELTVTMPGNTHGEGYECEASVRNADAYKAFDDNSNTYFYFDQVVDKGEYLLYRFTEPVRVESFRFYQRVPTSNYINYPVHGFKLEASNGDGNWVEFWSNEYTRHSDWDDYKAWWPNGSNSSIKMATSGTGYYSEYRIRYIDYLGGDVASWELYRVDLFGYKQSEHGPRAFEALAEGLFNYSKFTCEAGILQEGPRDRDWELIFFGKEPINSATSSGVTIFNELEPNDYEIKYSPKHSFRNGESVYMRVVAADPPSFNITYDPTECFLYLSPSGMHDVSFSDRLGMYGSYKPIYDLSPYRHAISGSYTSGGYLPQDMLITTTGVIYTQQSALQKLEADTYLHTEPLPAELLNTDWTFDCWLNTAQPTSEVKLFEIIDGEDVALSVRLDSSGFKIYEESTVYDFDFVYEANSWKHIAVVKKGDWILPFYKGYKLNGFLSDRTQTVSGSTCIIEMFRGMEGYMDMINWRKNAKWDSHLIASRLIDEIYLFTIASWKDLSVEITPVADTESPVVVPVAPLPEASGICPASGIVFDILDDYTGVDWDNLIVQIDGITVYSGGNNMTVWYEDRGTLIYEDRGQAGGEWVYDLPQGASGTVIQTDGVNRQLYPPGTVYSGTGAWGRRFTYYVPEERQLDYFDYRLQITISGHDNYGTLSQFDDKQPNRFEYNYGFDYITNDNIKTGNFFLAEGESERIDILQAQGKHIWVDLWDSDYPETDIVEENSYLRFYDGVLDFVCSGTWWTTYTGTEGTTSGIRVHRLHYDAGDYNWDGHRTMHWEVHAENDNPKCGVYDEVDYQLHYGWHIFWLHHDRRPPFPFNTKIPVFVSIKTQDYVPSRYSKSYMLWTAPAVTHDLNVGIKALPLTRDNELEVDLIAHSHYLQYSEDVDVEVYCKDRDGNELLYTWTFTTEDEP